MRRSDGPDTASAHPARLAVAGLTVERRETGRVCGRILDAVDLVIEPGEVAAVTGPSGAGKTTLLHAIAGLLTPDRGSVCWGGTDIGALAEGRRDRWRRDAVGLVFQDFQLLPELGVLDNILLPAVFDRWRIPGASRERARALALRAGLSDLARPAAALSRGEQQRVALARALIRGPALVLADEPTASLDPDNAARVADMLVGMARETGASLLVVSHDRAVLARAPRVLALDAGRLTTMDRTR